MSRRLRARIDVKKVTRFAVGINTLQILAMASVFGHVLFHDIAFLSRNAELALLGFCLLIVIWGAVMDIRDAMTTRKIAEQTQMIEEAYRQLEELNGTLRRQRHDFMNHIQVIYSLTELDERDSALEYMDRVYDDIQKVGRALKTSIPAINALLAAKMADCEEGGIAFVADIKSPWKDMPVPGWEMCRVLGNLIDNAMDAMKDAPEPRLLIRLSESVQSYTFVIANNGPMIQPSIAERIFQRGFSTKGEGRGMGLSIVRGIMESGGGRLTLASDERETRFEGTLPKTIAAPQALAESERART